MPHRSSNKSTIVRLSPAVRAARLAMAAAQTTSHGLAARWLERIFLTPGRKPVSAEESAFLRTGRYERVSSPPGELAVWSWGEGRTVLLAHGWGSCAARYRTLAPALVAAGFRVVAFDAPGHGQSAGRMSSLPQTARALRFLARRERSRRGALPHAVVGHSFGGAAAILAQESGVRFSANVMLAAVSDFDVPLQRVASGLGADKVVMRRMIQRLEQRLGFCWDAVHVASFASRLNAPALIVHDPADAEVPFSDAQSLSAAFPNAQLVSTPGLGHRRLLHDAAVVARVVEFVSLAQATHQTNIAARHAQRVSGLPVAREHSQEIAKHGAVSGQVARRGRE